MQTNSIKRKKNVTQSDIARACNVSQVTVSHVLNNREGTWISDELRQKILQTAMDMDYKLSKKPIAKCHYIGFVMSFAESEVGLRLLGGVIAGAERTNYMVGVASISNDPAHEREVLLNLIGKGVEGIVLWPALRSPEDVEKKRFGLDDINIPMVCVDSVCDYFRKAHIMFDYKEASRDLTGRLLDSGRRNVGYLYYFDEFFHSGCELRLQGYLAAHEERGLKPDKNLMMHTHNVDRCSVELEVRKLVNSGADAIIAQTDFLAMQVISELSEIGKRVPDDVRVAGFDNVSAGKVYSPSVTTVEEPWERMGEVAGNLLIEMIEGRGQVTDKIYLPAEVIERES